jgi:alpha-L-rhamnosidase
MNKCVGLILLAIQLAVTSILIGAETSPPQHLRCEFLNDPLGIDCPTPRLSWWLDDGRRGAIQTAYRILVASSPESLEKDVAELWDSGEVKSDQSHLVAYAGKPLTPHLDCSWKVRIWDQDGKPSAWSKPARWSMGPMGGEGWAKAKWIRLPSDVTASTIKVSVKNEVKRNSDRPEDQIMPVFRREFQIARPLRRAMLYVCGLGHHEILLDGQRVSNDLLDPPWTQYDKTIGYRTHDVTSSLIPGNHALGVMLGNGRYNTYGGKDRYVLWRQCFGQPQLIVQLRLEYADGAIDTVVSDNQWRAARGPVLFTCAYGGEDQDLGRLPDEWAKTGYDDSRWELAAVSDGPGGTLQWIGQEPLRATDKFAPRKMTQNGDGVVIDFGQNCNLMPVLRLSGSAGKTVCIYDSEGKTTGKNPRALRYKCTLAGRGEEVFRPRFVNYGSRSIFVEGANLDGADGKVKIHGAEGWSLRCSADVVGAFECSDPVVTAIDRIIYWSLQSNFQSTLTDCPQREKQGWLETSHLMAPAILFRLGAANFYRKIQNDMADMQDPKDGFIPTIAPFAPGDPRTGGPLRSDGYRNSPEWSSAFVINPDMVWQWTGDRTLIEKYYESMKRYVAYLTARSKNGILGYGLGDWMSRERTAAPIVATAIFYQDLNLMARYARILGKDADAGAYAAQTAAVKQAFAGFWKDEATGYGAGTQCAQAMPLFLGMADEVHRSAALARLIGDVKTKGSISGGDIGNRYILMTLAQAGQQELAFASTVSGEGFYMRMGREAARGDRTTLGGDTQNHLMLGHVQEWLHGYLLGIRPDPDSPGFKRFLLEPNPVGDLTWAKGHHDGPYGRISLHWRRQDGRLLVDCTVPPNSQALFRLPTREPNGITEQGKPFGVGAKVQVVAGRAEAVVVALEPGTYQFSSPWPPDIETRKEPAK